MIPLFKVRADFDGFVERVRPAFEAGYIGQGPLVDEFERALSNALSIWGGQILTVNSGTSALQLALALEGCGKGKDVIVSPMTCMADAHAVLAMGGRIVWSDVDRRTGLMDPASVAGLITDRTCAIMPTDLGGLTPDSTRLSRVAGDIAIIEDAAQNFDGTYYGDYIALSFQAIKHLTTGDGGALIVRDADKAEEGRLRRWFGLDRTSSADFRCQQNIRLPGYKFHMTDIDAALGLANLDAALRSVYEARENARYYQERLPAEVLVPWQESGTYWLYTILVEDRERFMAKMGEYGVAVSPVHAIGTKHDLFPDAELPGAEWYCARNVAIPNGWWLTKEDRERVLAATLKSL